MRRREPRDAPGLARQAGDLRRSWALCWICGKIPARRLPNQEEVTPRPHARQAAGRSSKDCDSDGTCRSRRPGKWLGANRQPGACAYHAVPTNSAGNRRIPTTTSPSSGTASLGRRSQKDAPGMAANGEIGRRVSPQAADTSIPGRMCALPSDTRGRSRVPELGSLGSVRGAFSNERPYRERVNPSAGVGPRWWLR